MNYKLTYDPDAVLTNGTLVPRGHYLWEEYEAWLAAGNTPDPEFTPEQIQASIQDSFESAVQSLHDTTAQKYGYDSIRSAISYADDPTVAEFQAEGQAFRTWRSLCWQYAYAQLAAVKAGTISVPSLADFLARLPASNLGAPAHG